MSEVAIKDEVIDIGDWEETFFPLVWGKCKQLCEKARQAAGVAVMLNSQSLDDISGLRSLARDECLKSLEAIKNSERPMVMFADEFERLTDDIVSMYLRVIGIMEEDDGDVGDG